MINTAGSCDPPLSFGIEIESVVQPRKYRSNDVQHYEALARRLTGCYDIRADWNRGNRRKGTDYNVRYITRDGSLKAKDHEGMTVYIPFERCHLSVPVKTRRLIHLLQLHLRLCRPNLKYHRVGRGKLILSRQ